MTATAYPVTTSSVSSWSSQTTYSYHNVATYSSSSKGSSSSPSSYSPKIPFEIYEDIKDIVEDFWLERQKYHSRPDYVTEAQFLWALLPIEYKDPFIGRVFTDPKVRIAENWNGTWYRTQILSLGFRPYSFEQNSEKISKAEALMILYGCEPRYRKW